MTTHDAASARPSPPAPRPAVPRRLRWLLIGSLALNVLVLGGFAGMGLRHAGPGVDRPGPEHSAGLGPWGGGALRREDHRALRQAFAAAGYDFRADRRADREDRARLLAALRLEPFDMAAVRAVADSLEARAAERMALGNRMILEHVAGLSAAERREMADRMEAALERKPSRRGPPPPEARP